MKKKYELEIVKQLDKTDKNMLEQLQEYKKFTKKSRATFYRDRQRLSLFKGEMCYFCNKPTHLKHHINQDKEDNRKENLLPLCISCHQKIHRILYNLTS